MCECVFVDKSIDVAIIGYESDNIVITPQFSGTQTTPFFVAKMMLMHAITGTIHL